MPNATKIDPTQIYPHLPVILPDLGLTVILIKTPLGTFSPIAPLCRQLGEIEPQSQVERLQRDPKFSPFLERIMAPTARGHKPSWCLRRHLLGDWMHTINQQKVRTQFHDRYADIQARITQFSDQAHFGVALANAVDPAPAPMSASKSGPIKIGEAKTKFHASMQVECECGRVHCIIVEPGNVVTYIGVINRDEDE